LEDSPVSFFGDFPNQRDMAARALDGRRGTVGAERSGVSTSARARPFLKTRTVGRGTVGWASARVAGKWARSIDSGWAGAVGAPH
jgi:hypothetical protein